MTSVEIHHQFNTNATIRQGLVINVQMANQAVNHKETARAIANRLLLINATVILESVYHVGLVIKAV